MHMRTSSHGGRDPVSALGACSWREIGFPVFHLLLFRWCDRSRCHRCFTAQVFQASGHTPRPDKNVGKVALLTRKNHRALGGVGGGKRVHGTPRPCLSFVFVFQPCRVCSAAAPGHCSRPSHHNASVVQVARCFPPPIVLLVCLVFVCRLRGPTVNVPCVLGFTMFTISRFASSTKIHK